jgi:hypothetical protein
LYPVGHDGATGGLEADKHIIEPGSYAVRDGHVPVIRTTLGVVVMGFPLASRSEFPLASVVGIVVSNPS